MPIYEYHCESCEHTFDHMTSMSTRDQKPVCPSCGGKKTARKLSVVAVGANAQAAPGSAGGHTHSGMCGCGKRQGSCGMN